MSLPGRSIGSTENEDTASNIQASLSELAAIGRQETLHDDIRRDLRWNNASRNALKGVKSAEELAEMLDDVLKLKDQALRNTITNQRTMLKKYHWDDQTIENWSYGGYITQISRLSMDHYISLLQHLMQVSTSSGWDMAKKEIEFYLKKFNMIRGNSQSRIMALCRIYVVLRDGFEGSWRSNKLEAEKIVFLYEQLRTFREGSSLEEGPSPSDRPPPSGPALAGVCRKCGTCLHGNNPCPWTSLSNTRAKKAGRDALAALAGGTSTGEAA